MINGRLFVTSAFLAAMLSSSVYADVGSSSLSQFKQSYLSSPKVRQVIEGFNHKNVGSLNLSGNVISKLRAFNQQEIQILGELRSHSLKLNFNDNLVSKLDLLISKKNNTKFSPAMLHQENAEMNFLNLQLSDAFMMVDSVNKSALFSLKIIEKMHELAVQVANGTNSQSDMENLNVEFQLFKETLHYVQTVDLINGEKNVSGGDITIYFGDEQNELSTLTLPVPAFDVVSLGLSDAVISSHSKAQEALSASESAIETLNHVLASTSEPVISDALTMLLIVPHVLSLDFDLFSDSKDLALQSLNGATSDNDRVYLDMTFDYIKKAMNKVQTYTSLQGSKLLGTGNIHVQIGKYASSENTLSISLPVTDVKKLGLDKFNVKSTNAAYDALSSIMTDIHDFTYVPSRV